MEVEKLKKRKAMLSNSIIPWFIGLSDDLMFFIAINSLFFTVVKGFSASQITFLTTVSNVFYILLQIPALKIIQKIGNIRSIRIGTIMLLCSSILITFGNSYWITIIGYLLYQPAFIFKKMEVVVLKNNLQYLNRQEEYIKFSSRSKLIYSIITTIIAFVAGGIFAINHYFPMYLCIGICCINFLLSFCIFDVNDNVQKSYEIDNKEKLKLSKVMITIFISFALLYATINIGQSNSQLFIQYNLQKHFNIELTAMYLGGIIAISRVARVFGNLIFNKVYDKYKDKVNILLSIMAMVSFALILLGSFLDSVILVKFIIMTAGFNIILAIRDLVEIYMSDLLLKNTQPKHHQKAISYLQLSRRIFATIISLIFSILLIQLDLMYIIICLFVLAMISLMINSKLYTMINKKGEKYEL